MNHNLLARKKFLWQKKSPRQNPGKQPLKNGSGGSLNSPWL
jgi:hypothetical protein